MTTPAQGASAAAAGTQQNNQAIAAAADAAVDQMLDVPTRTPEELVKLLVTDDAPAPAAGAAGDAKAPEPDADAAEPQEKQDAGDDAGKAEEKVEGEGKTDEGAAAAQPGTPDKVVQRLQQDLAAATRKLEEIDAKLESGQALSKKETEQQQAAARKIDTVRDALKAKGAEFDVLDKGVGAALAGTLVEMDEDLKTAKAELAELKRGTAAQRQAAQAQSDAANWAAVKTQYAGVDVEAVWEKAAADAAELMGVDVETVQNNPALQQAARNTASRIFHERAKAAHKRVADSAAAAAEAAKKKGKAKSDAAPATSAAGGRVSQGSGSGAAAGDETAEARYLRNAIAVVTDD